MKYVNAIIDFLISKRAIALYWHSGVMFITGFLAIMLGALQEWNSESIITVLAGLVIAQITKHLNTKKKK